ncbi:MAG: hypothetical protein KatS3mg038_0103 [Candidatus Kapaibacterium sp.]|nr:MAG: hypothetical protein KatS3mg038_0103 [Candidatus Kapabacteria bacterium]
MSLPTFRMEASDEQFIAAPTHRVWHLLRHIERWERWNPYVRVFSARPALNPQRFWWKVSGIRFQSEITAERPTRTLQWRSSGRGLVATRSWLLLSEGEGTRVITHADVEGLALAIRPTASERLLRLRTRQVLAALRAAAESSPEHVRAN